MWPKINDMAKVAKLVLVSLMTRVVVDENASYEDVIEAARPQLEATLRTDLFENIEEVFEDKECPFGVMDMDYLGG